MPSHYIAPACDWGVAPFIHLLQSNLFKVLQSHYPPPPPRKFYCSFFTISENVGTPQYGGVIIYSLSDVPLGFGIAAQPTEYCKDLEPGANVVLHQGDIGEYLRIEDGLF